LPFHANNPQDGDGLAAKVSISARLGRLSHACLSGTLRLAFDAEAEALLCRNILSEVFSMFAVDFGPIVLFIAALVTIARAAKRLPKGRGCIADPSL
jgi:hypothetical protein